MDALHRAYVSFTEHGWLIALVVSCVVAIAVSLKAVPLSAAIATLALGLLLTIGWMILDLAFFPGSHNLLPFEALFKLLLVLPLAGAVLYKWRRRIRSPNHAASAPR